MIVSMHQPNYLPWSGFFHKMSRSDVLVLLDTVQYTKNGFQNRTQIKTPQGASWLTVPVLTRGRFKQVTNLVEIDKKTGWKRKHLRSIETNYGRAPHFERYLSWLEDLYGRDWDKLVDLNTFAIRYIAEELKIETRIVMASCLGVSGSGSELLLSICETLGASVYLSGPSGKRYLEEKRFEERNIRVAFHGFVHPAYGQQFGGFVPNLSIIDLLLNRGSQGFAF